uniref:Kinesin motor domain-containing protein n=1 Tax=Scylla olivacea TaxID=85551 RepID=A0A0P4VRF3_SCYOL
MSDIRVMVWVSLHQEGGGGQGTSHTGTFKTTTALWDYPAYHKPLAAPHVFDGMSGPNMESEDVYCEVAITITESSLTGFNNTTFVYGQSSSGNTSTTTMATDHNIPGITPVAAQNIFHFTDATPECKY